MLDTWDALLVAAIFFFSGMNTCSLLRRITYGEWDNRYGYMLIFSVIFGLGVGTGLIFANT